MNQANLTVFERSEFSEFAVNINFSSLRNLASNELFFIHVIVSKIVKMQEVNCGKNYK